MSGAEPAPDGAALGGAALGGAALDEAERLRAAVGDFVRHVRAHDAMPRGQAAVLGHLVREGDLSITDLAVREAVRHQSMARTVKQLEAAHLVTTAPDDRDRRRVVVHVTDSGAARLADERELRATWIASAISERLSDAERAVCRQIPDVLERLTAQQERPGR